MAMTPYKRPAVKENLYDLWTIVEQYKFLHNYYWERENSKYKIKTRKQLEDRVRYILKNKLKQRGEIETILWVLGVDSLDEFDLETKTTD